MLMPSLSPLPVVGGRRRRCRLGAVGLLAALVLFAAAAGAPANDRGDAKAKRDAADLVPVLGLALRAAQLRLIAARAACDRHAARHRGDAARRHDGGVAALLALANCYKTGNGRPKRLLRARVLFEAAAARGSPRADLALGQFYRDGAIVRRDLTKAAYHFRRAARAGLAEGMIELGLVLRRAERDHAAACRWFERSARANARAAIRLLGDCFAHDIGGRADRSRARTLYRRAALLGDDTARLKLLGHRFVGAGADIARWEGCDWAARSAGRNNVAAMHAVAFCVGALR